ncbi:MAG TPA: thioredoxin-like domain-containing protein [Puia sp.]|jgi:peroxiredoxin
MNKLLFAALACFALSCRSNDHFIAESPMPSMSMLLVDSSAYSTDQLRPGRYTVIMYFRTDCSHCQQETADLIKNYSALQDINIILLTPKPLKDVRQYAAFFKLDHYPHIQAASDHRRQFWNYYQPANVPYLVVYDRQNRLYRICEGPLPVDSLIALNQL